MGVQVLHKPDAVQAPEWMEHIRINLKISLNLYEELI